VTSATGQSCEKISFSLAADVIRFRGDDREVWRPGMGDHRSRVCCTDHPSWRTVFCRPAVPAEKPATAASLAALKKHELEELMKASEGPPSGFSRPGEESLRGRGLGRGDRGGSRTTTLPPVRPPRRNRFGIRCGFVPGMGVTWGQPAAS